MPTDIGIVDTMIDFPHPDMAETYRFITEQARDRETRETFEFPAEYLFKDVPDKALRDTPDPIAVTVDEMDRWGIDRGLVGVDGEESPGREALRRHPDRFIPSGNADPNRPREAERIRRLRAEWDIRAIGVFPSGTFPQVAIDDAAMFPVYEVCQELGIAVFCCAGYPGPRLRAAPQRVELIDEVMYRFPELTFVTRHGCEPWEDLAVKLMLKWPGLHYSTSAFAPRYYPRAIVDFANSRGADKVIYAGYFPMGLSLERIVTELRDVPFADHVWPRFLRTNALRVLGYEPGT